MALISLENVKTFLGITGSAKDDVLNLLIEQASDMFETLTERTFDSSTYTNEEYDGTGNRQIQLKQYPIITFSQLQKRTTFDNTDSWETIATTDYWVDTENGIVTKTSSYADWDVQFKDPQLTDDPTWLVGKNNYRATYTAGFATIPNDIQLAVMHITGFLLNTRSTAGIESETLGDRTLKLKASGSSDLIGGYIGKIIDKYKEICL